MLWISALLLLLVKTSFKRLPLLLCCVPTGPALVGEVRKDSASHNSISLSWSQVEQPPSNIVDYEVKYYEKVESSLQSINRPQFFHSKLHEKRGCRASLPAVQCALKHPYSQMCWSIRKMLPSLLCSPSALTLNWLKCMCCVSDIAGMISLYNHEFVRLWLSAF